MSPTTINTIRTLVHRLAVATHPYRDNSTVTREAALTQLRGAIRPDNGATGSGRSASSSTRVPLDVAALDLYEYVTGQIDTLYSGAIGINPHGGTPEQNLLDWYEEVSWAHRQGELTEMQVQVAADRLTNLEARIENYFDPPRIVEVLAPCPSCGARHVTLHPGTHDATRITALIYLVTQDGTVTLECRNTDCQATWHGEHEIASLRNKNPEKDHHDQSEGKA